MCVRVRQCSAAYMVDTHIMCSSHHSTVLKLKTQFCYWLFIPPTVTHVCFCNKPVFISNHIPPSDLLLRVLPVGGSQLLLCLPCSFYWTSPAARWDNNKTSVYVYSKLCVTLWFQMTVIRGMLWLYHIRRTMQLFFICILFPPCSPLLSRLGSSVAQLPVVLVRWTHPQEVPHLDSHTAPGYF